MTTLKQTGSWWRSWTCLYRFLDEQACLKKIKNAEAGRGELKINIILNTHIHTNTQLSLQLISCSSFYSRCDTFDFFSTRTTWQRMWTLHLCLRNAVLVTFCSHCYKGCTHPFYFLLPFWPCTSWDRFPARCNWRFYFFHFFFGQTNETNVLMLRRSLRFCDCSKGCAPLPSPPKKVFSRIH